MALLGIDASISFLDGSTVVSGVGTKDLTLSIASTEVPVESRGYDFKRYLRAQKDAPLSFSSEADAPCVAFLRTKYYSTGSAANVPTTFTEATGDTFEGVYIVTKMDASNGVNGEAEYTFEMKLSATAALADQPTHTAPTANSSP